MKYKYHINSMDDYNKIPKYATHLIFGKKFNKQIIIPKKIINVFFGTRSTFNQRIIIRNNVKSIKFDNRFEQKIIVPNSVTNLKILSVEYNKKIIIPNNVIYLTLNCEYDKCLTIPNSVKYFNSSEMGFYPKSLGNNLLYICSNLKKNMCLPHSVVHLLIDVGYNKNKLSNNVEKFYFHCENQLSHIIPSSIKTYVKVHYYNIIYIAYNEKKWENFWIRNSSIKMKTVHNRLKIMNN